MLAVEVVVVHHHHLQLPELAGHRLGLLRGSRCLGCRERQPLSHRDAVPEDMQVGVAEIDDALAVRPFDPGVVEVPLFRHRPVERLGSRLHLGDLQGHPLADQLERPAQAVAGDAAADREELADELVHVPADVVRRRQGLEVDARHSPARTLARTRSAPVPSFE